MVVKIVYDLMVSCLKDVKENFIAKFNDRFTLGTITHGPGLTRFYGLNLIQNEEFLSRSTGMKSSMQYRLLRYQDLAAKNRYCAP